MIRNSRWRDWLAEFNRLCDDPSKLDDISNLELFTHLSRCPPRNMLSNAEAKYVRDELLQRIIAIQRRVQSGVNLGFIEFGVAMTGSFGAICFPQASIVLSFIPLGAAGISVWRNWKDKSRQNALNVMITQLESLREMLR